MLDHALFVVPTSVEEMLPPVRFANPLALALCILQWLLLAPLRAPPREAVVQNGRGWDRYEEKGAAAPGRGGIMGSRTVSY